IRIAFAHIGRLQALLLREPVAVLDRILPGDVHDGLVVEIERVLTDDTRTVARSELAKLAVRDLVDADIERSGDLHRPLRFVRATTWLLPGAAHREAPGR